MFALLFEENHLLLKLRLRFTRTSTLLTITEKSVGFWWKTPRCCIHPFLIYLQVFIFLRVFPFLNVTRLSADSHGALSSSADQKRLLLPSSVPLTYWYSVTFEFHNRSTTFIMAHFRQRCHEALQHFLRCVIVNESRWCVTVCSEIGSTTVN